MSTPPEPDVVNRFIAFLVDQRGYPPESLLRDYPLPAGGGSLRPDLVITDVDRATVLAIVEFRGAQPDGARPDLSQLDQYRAAVRTSIPAYVVTPSPAGFDVFTKGLNNVTVRADSTGFPPYSGLSAASGARERLEAKGEQRAVIDFFRWTCYLLAAGAFFLFFLNTTGRIDLSPEDLALIGAAIGLILIPGAAKLKVLGIEFERLAQDHRRAKES